MLDYSETLENVYLAFNQHIGLKNKNLKIWFIWPLKASRTCADPVSASTNKNLTLL